MLNCSQQTSQESCIRQNTGAQAWHGLQNVQHTCPGSGRRYQLQEAEATPLWGGAHAYFCEKCQMWANLSAPGWGYKTQGSNQCPEGGGGEEKVTCWNMWKMERSASRMPASPGGAPGLGTSAGSKASMDSRKAHRCHRLWMMTFRKQLFWPLSLVRPLQPRSRLRSELHISTERLQGRSNTDIIRSYCPGGSATCPVTRYLLGQNVRKICLGIRWPLPCWVVIDLSSSEVCTVTRQWRWLSGMKHTSWEK